MLWKSLVPATSAEILRINIEINGGFMLGFSVISLEMHTLKLVKKKN